MSPWCSVRRPLLSVSSAGFKGKRTRSLSAHHGGGNENGKGNKHEANEGKTTTNDSFKKGSLQNKKWDY